MTVVIRKNGTAITGLTTNLSLVTYGYWYQFSGNGLVSISSGDIITIVIASTVGTVTFIGNQISFSLTQID